MLNQVQLIGRLGGDHECKTLASGKSVVNVSIATTESWKDKDTGQKKEVTDWHRVVVYGALADVFSKWLHKGSLIYVQGRLKTRSWDDKGSKRYITEVICDQMRMLGGKKEDGGHAQEEVPPAEPEGQVGSGEEDLPFYENAMNIDDQVQQARDEILNMPNDEFERRWNPETPAEEKKAKKTGMSESQSWFEALLDVTL